MRQYAELLIYAGRKGTGAQPPPRIWRRLFHLTAGSCIPAAAIFAPEREFLIGLAALAAGAVLLDLSRFGVGPLNRIYMRLMAPLLKGEEEVRMTGATHMLVAAAALFWLFGRDVGIPVMFFLSLGDPVAAIVGSRLPGPRLAGKSPGGTLAFAATGAAIAAILVSTGAVAHSWALWPGAAIAALVELAGLPPDDNLTVPIDCRSCHVGHGRLAVMLPIHPGKRRGTHSGASLRHWTRRQRCAAEAVPGAYAAAPSNRSDCACSRWNRR